VTRSSADSTMWRPRIGSAGPAPYHRTMRTITIIDHGSTTRRPARSARRCAAVLIGVLGLTLFSDAAFATTKKTTTKKTTTKKTVAKKTSTATTSTAKFCAAAKAWLAFENETLAEGPYDALWVLRTHSFVLPLAKAAPTAIRGDAALFIISLLTDRRLIAGVQTIDNEDDIYWLREFAADETRQSTMAARDAFGAYTLKTCKIDVLQPFRDLAKGFE
jgi:hypothetical protein